MEALYGWPCLPHLEAKGRRGLGDLRDQLDFRNRAVFDERTSIGALRAGTMRPFAPSTRSPLGLFPEKPAPRLCDRIIEVLNRGSRGVRSPADLLGRVPGANG